MESPKPQPSGPKPVVPSPRTPSPPPQARRAGPVAAGAKDARRKGKAPLYLLGAAAALALGFVVFGGGGRSESRVEVTPVTNPAAMQQLIRDMPIPDPEKRRLEREVAADQIELWQYTVLGSGGAASEVYTVSTDRGSHTYSVGEQAQEFVLATTKGSPGFTFNALTDNQHPGMPGRWTTPKGTFPFDMQPGGALTIPVR